VLAASDPAVALELSRSYAGEIHLLMTDVLMPGMTGMDVWRTLHLERPAMKCLFVSGYAAPDSILGRSLDDSSDYLGKPFPLQALKQKIEKLLHGGPEPAAGDGQQP
jgi:YesN/AraC family two-component response regulator